VRLSQQTPIIFVNNNGPMITSSESNTLLFCVKDWCYLTTPSIAKLT